VAYKFWDTCSALGVLVLLCDEMDSNALNNFLASFLPRVFFSFFLKKKFVKYVDWRLSTRDHTEKQTFFRILHSFGDNRNLLSKYDNV